MVRIWESIFTYILYISCVYQMQQKLQATWCSDAVIFFATFFVVVTSLAKEVMFLVALVSLSVCLSVCLSVDNITALHKA